VKEEDFLIIFQSKTNGKIKFATKETVKIILEWNNKIEELRILSIKTYKIFLEEWNKIYREIMEKLNYYVAEIDFYKSCAKTAIKYKYSKPTLIKEENINNNIDINVLYNDKDIFEGSYVGVKNMRHPIVERISENKYQPHTLLLGKSSENNVDIANGKGMLVFGLNSSGKSCLMKAIGINVIMAQAGMYVACEKMILKPYKSVLTRILGNDNIYKGLSSFAVEMNELRGILTRANKNALVLGDEICHGTETISAVSIVASSIMKLSKMKASFILATHLHKLIELDEIIKLNKEKEISIYHLYVEHDIKTHTLKYNRELRLGSGDAIYGIEVAKAMDLDDEVIQNANKIRMKILEIDNNIIKMKKSNYNTKIYMDLCMKCKKKYSEETHHKEQQQYADKNGFINHMHKNHISNLETLCKECHDNIHSDNKI
jgi:DNA mismatch repair protein MutS